MYAILQDIYIHVTECEYLGFNLFKEFKIFTNNCKKLVRLGRLEAIPTDMGLFFGKSESTKVTSIFLERIFLVL